MFRVSNRTLLALAALIWGAAGVNILRIGLASARVCGNLAIWAGAVVIFLLFHRFVFGPLVGKHVVRIHNYTTPQGFWMFFDGKSYLIMACMMTAGIGLRRSGWVPEWFFAFFYTGLGSALLLAGLRFGWYALKYERSV